MVRALVVARLILYNFRRGEESSRLLPNQYNAAVEGSWDIDAVEYEAEKVLLGKFVLAYMAGKGKRFVPVLILKDIKAAINTLTQNRDAYGIRKENIFLFAPKKNAAYCSE